jgi:hypothetical protein
MSFRIRKSPTSQSHQRTDKIDTPPPLEQVLEDHSSYFTEELVFDETSKMWKIVKVPKTLQE